MEDRPGEQQERVPHKSVPPQRNPLRPLSPALQIPAEQQAAVPGLSLLHLQELQPLQQEGARLGLRSLPPVQVPPLQWRARGKASLRAEVQEESPKLSIPSCLLETS